MKETLKSFLAVVNLIMEHKRKKAMKHAVLLLKKLVHTHKKVLGVGTKQ